MTMSIGRNKPCPCGSGKRYKKCCGDIITAQNAVGPGAHPDISIETQSSLLVRQGNELRQQNRLEEALACYHQALQVDPKYASAYNGIGNISLSLGKLEDALSAYDEAIRLKPDFSPGHYNRGNVLQELNRYDESISAYKEALNLTPNDSDIYSNLGLALMRAGQPDAALDACRKALQLNPDDTLAYNNMSGAFVAQGRLIEAEDILLKGLNKKPDHVELCITLAVLYERLNKIDQSAKYIEKALAQDSHNLHAKLSKAILLRRQERFDDGLSILSGITIPSHDKELAQKIHFELARLYDLKHESANAIHHFSAANRISKDLMSEQKEVYYQAVNGIRESINQHGPELLNSIVVNESRKEKQPVFLVGFPRSGTTLLEQILDSHSELQVLDEKPMLVKVLRQIASRSGNYLDILPNLSETDVQLYREMYLKEAQKYDIAKHVQLVDKQPLNIVHCNLIAKLFPGARVIVNLRHPCDVCLSCFMQDFKANDAMANFTTLEDTVKLYIEVMGLFLEYEQTLPLDFYRFHYEGLIEDFESEARRVLNFLDISWSDNLRQYHLHAAGKTAISTASYSQVVEPLYNRAKFRWLRYRHHLSPYLPELRPFIDAFGYQES